MTGARPLLVSSIAAFLVSAILHPAPAVPQTRTGIHYLHRGERVELELSATTLSVGTYPGESLAARSSLRLSSGLHEITARPFARDVWRIDLVSSSSRAAGTADLARVLAADPAVEWVYVALRNRSTGTLLLPTPRLIARVRPGITEEALRSALPAGVAVVGRLRGTRDRFRLKLTDPENDDPAAVSVALSQGLDWFEWVEPDFIQEWRFATLPDDPLFFDQWHLRNTGQGGGIPGADSRTHQAWDFETGDGSVVIAILDDGVQSTHPDLETRIFTNPGEVPGNGLDDDQNGYVDDLYGWDFFDDDNAPDPDLTGPGSHGTAVAGIAAAAGDNSIGGTGACRNCSILPVRVAGTFFGSSSFVNDSTLAEAILYAGSLADVLNNSWGGGSVSSAIDDALAEVTTTGRSGLGAPVLFSAGNSASAWIRREWKFFGNETLTRTLEWSFEKDAAGSVGFDTAWLDAVALPDGTFEDFENCTTLPSGWDTGGDAPWTPVDDGRRATSLDGGNCSIKAGEIGDSQRSWVRITQTFDPPASVVFSAWVSAEPEGIIRTSGGCLDGLVLNIYDSAMNLLDSRLPQCGTWSNQFTELQDGAISYPASHPSAIAVGSATNFDRRSDYSQYGPDLDFLAHSNGGSLAIVTTDVTGSFGYDDSDYTTAFGGTSAAAPHAAGIVGLLLTQRPALTAFEVRQTLREATRKIGSEPYLSGRNDLHGHGALDASVVLTPLDIFADDFESGGFEAWSAFVP